MPQRQKILLSILGAAAILLVGYRTVYPKWIKPVFDVSTEIAISEAELKSLEDKWNRHMRTQQPKYKEYVLRSGGTDAKQVKNYLLARLNRLISKSDLSNKGITPQTPKVNRKTHLQEFRFDIRAEGKLESVIEFLVLCEELPQLVRLAEIRLNPASTGRRGKTEDRIALFCRLEVVVPSAVDGAMMVKVGPDDQPDTIIRHQGEAELYASIWDAQPFTEWKEPKRDPPKHDPPRLAKNGDDQKRDPPVRQRDNREDKGTLVDLVAIYGDGDRMVQEVHTRPKRGRHRGEYRSLGDDMDGGKLVMVHPLGAVVRRDGEDYFYARGLTFGDSIQLAQATEYPEVIAQMRWLDELRTLEGEQNEDNEQDATNESLPDGEADSAERAESDSDTKGVGRADRATNGPGKRTSKGSKKVRKGSTSGRRPLPMSERAEDGDTDDKVESPPEEKQTDESDADKKETKDADDSNEVKDDN